MEERNEFGGLCTTCNNAPCFHHVRRGPAFYCEMFDDYLPPVEPAAKAKTTFRELRHAKGDAGARAFAGLCANCDHRLSCTHPMPEGGVWHCEDYE